MHVGVKLFQGEGEGRCAEEHVGSEFHPKAVRCQYSEVTKAGMGAGFLAADIAVMILLVHRLVIAAQKGGAVAVGIVLPRSQAEEIHLVKTAVHGKAEAETGELRQAFQFSVHGLRDKDASVPGKAVLHLHGSLSADTSP